VVHSVNREIPNPNQCRFLKEGSRCHSHGALAPTNAEMVVNDDCEILLYCVASLSTLAQQSCSSYDPVNPESEKTSGWAPVQFQSCVEQILLALVVGGLTRSLKILQIDLLFDQHQSSLLEENEYRYSGSN